jgi:hypothetical protein
MNGFCNKHPFEHAAAACRSCAELYCSDCLVFANGPDKPPYCVSCALVVAGVRRLTAKERRAHRDGRRRAVAAAPVELDIIEELGPLNHLSMASKGRSRIGMLAVACTLVVVAVPLAQHFLL